MNQIFIFGSSSAYGVGGVNGGWATLLKQKLHTLMYSSNGVGEKYELYNFSKPGAPINFVQETFQDQLKNYKRNGLTIALISVGGNNSKAEDEPENYVSTIDEYRQEITTLLKDIKANIDHVMFIGSGFVDESKTNPKPNPLTGGVSYFSNARRREFDDALRLICNDLQIAYIDMNVPMNEWVEKYTYEDGLHSNDAGHEFICQKVWNVVQLFLK